MRRFTERFAPHGFRREAMAPVYGLAECSLALAFPPLGAAAGRRRRGPRDLPATRARPCPAAAAAIATRPALRLLRLPRAGPRDPDRGRGRPRAGGAAGGAAGVPGPVGHQRLLPQPRGHREAGARRAGSTRATAAYIAGGEVYITGRVKDVIIRAGRNLYPHELEEAVGEIPGVRKGCVAVFGSADPATGTERLVVLAETRGARRARRWRRCGRRSRTSPWTSSARPPTRWCWCRRTRVPKTSSGKIRRAAARELYEQRAARPGGAALGLVAARAARRHRGARARLAPCAPRRRETALGGLGLAALRPGGAPALARRWRRAGPRPPPAPGPPRGRGSLAALTGTPSRCAGCEHLAGRARRWWPRTTPSYLDGFVLTARAAAATSPSWSRASSSERLHAAPAAAPRRRLRRALRRRPAARPRRARRGRRALGGESLIVFPEGTFRARPGLLPFRLGAFVGGRRRRGCRWCRWRSAARARCCAAAPGARAAARSRSRSCRRSFPAAGAGWAAAVGLRDAVRAEILARCGEPDLGAE